MQLRAAHPTDTDSVLAVYRSAFTADECEPVAALAVDLLHEPSSPATRSLVAEIDREVVGHVAFSPVTVEGDGGLVGYILAPLAVAATHQNRGIGSQLVRAGLEQLDADGVEVVLVYGDPVYYGRFGFEAANAQRYRPPYELAMAFGWQARCRRDPPADAPVIPLKCVPPLESPALW